jgi:hypothetical protein
MAKANAVLSALEQEYDEALKARQMEEQLRQMTLDELRRYEVRASDKLREPKPVIALRGKIIGSEGNLSAVVGEAKSKKTFLCTAIVGSMPSAKLLRMDTIQSAPFFSMLTKLLSEDCTSVT